MPSQPSPARFLTPQDVAEELNTSHAQVMALLRSGELAAIKVGARGFWRIERCALEDYTARCYEQTRRFIPEHPAADGDNEQRTNRCAPAGGAMATVTAVIYSRISHDPEGRQAGVQRQEQDCRQLAAERGRLVLEPVYRENEVSASTRSKKRRPVFEQMLNDLSERSAGVLLASRRG